MKIRKEDKNVKEKSEKNGKEIEISDLDENLNEKLQEIFKNIEASAIGSPTSNNEPDNIQNILNAYINRKTEKHFTALVKKEDIENTDYNLSVSTYVESEDTREVIDIAVLNKQISEIVQHENTLRDEINAIIDEIEVN